MPFAAYAQPPLALGLLKACLSPLGLPVRVFPFNLLFAECIGAALYRKIASWPIVDLLGDWVFAGQLFPPDPGAEDAYRKEILAGGNPAHNQAYFGKEPPSPLLWEKILGARLETGPFLEKCLEKLAGFAPRVVGFTSLFHQQLASLALAERIKERLPEALVLFGGANCREPMGTELLARFPFLDGVFPGEGEGPLTELVRRLQEKQSLEGTPGVLLRNAPFRPAPFTDLAELPPPEHDDFLAAWADTKLPDKGIPRFPIETSRGCWWGERSRCVFCGQASNNLAYRTRPPKHALAEIRRLAESLPQATLLFTDEIVPADSFPVLLPGLASLDPPLSVAYFQVRPDLPLKNLESLRMAGVRRLEVGLESLSTSVLKMMRKGVRALGNIRFLKWCRELQLDLIWNWLWGIPGEPTEEYTRMARLVPWLTHLQPPRYVGSIRLDRFSPLFEDSQSWGMTTVRPYPSYRHIYRLPEDALANLAYHFIYEYRQPQPVAAYTEPLAEAIQMWKESYAQSAFLAETEGDHLLLIDRRDPRREEQVAVLTGLHSLAYQACGEICSLTELGDQLLRSSGEHLDENQLRDLLQPMLEEGWMVQEDDAFLSLALRQGSFQAE